MTDRDQIEAWIRKQPIACRVEFGDLEPFDETDVRRDITEHEFLVDNLTADEQMLARQQREAIAARIAALKQRKNAD